MATTVTYKGATLTTVDNTTKTLETAGTWMEDDLTLTDVSGGGGSIDLSAIAQSANLGNIGGLFNAFMNSTWGYVELTVVSGTNPIEIDFGRAIKGFVAYPKSVSVLSGLDVNERNAFTIATFDDPDGTGAQALNFSVTRWKANGQAPSSIFNRIASWTLVDGLLSLEPNFPTNMNYHPFGFGNVYTFVYWW